MQDFGKYILHYSDFFTERMSTNTQHDAALNQQANVMQKLCHFINYLMLVNCQTEVASKGDREIQNLSYLLE